MARRRVGFKCRNCGTFFEERLNHGRCTKCGGHLDPQFEEIELPPPLVSNNEKPRKGVVVDGGSVRFPYEVETEGGPPW